MKDIKTKPQTTTKSVKNSPKSVEHSAKTAAWDIKTVAKDTLVKNAIDKQFDIKHSEQPQRAEVEATEQVENAYYSAVDTVYQKGKSLAENKLKQHRQQVKAKENANTPSTPQADFSEVQNTPKQAVHTPKTKESINHLHTKMLQRCRANLPHRLRPKKHIQSRRKRICRKNQRIRLKQRLIT